MVFLGFLKEGLIPLCNVSDLIGIPFLDGGRDPREGLDCWGLVKEVYKRIGIELPEYNISAVDTKGIQKQIDYERMQEDWEKIDKPESICFIVFKSACGRITNHLGVYLEGIKFIHILVDREVSIGRLDHPLWKNRIESYYRWTGR